MWLVMCSRVGAITSRWTMLHVCSRTC
uniref:Uncharacterized protein n=1 Tax=Arundo donax TaxID=35708 RepID=A0A0A9CAG7_ARUDO